MVSSAEAKRIAIAAQGFGAGGDLLPMIRRLGVLQIDSVNVLARAHYLPLFARLGPYDRAKLEALARGHSKRALFEYWGHQASFLPVELYPLFGWRMERAIKGEGTWGRIARYAKEKRAYLKRVLAEIEARGPTAASELSTAEKKSSGWWEWSEAKHAVETLFWQGRLAVASRKTSFERLYDLPERVIPAAAFDAKAPSAADAHRALLAISARALGIGTEDDLCDYFRLARAESRPRIHELEEEGILRRVDVESWDKPAWVHRACTKFARSSARRSREPVAALVGPFDPIVWHRPRALRMFGFHYRIGIYTPAHQRTHGYYVMPFLLDDALVARVDLKADRGSGILRVQAAWLEEGCSPDVAAPLAKELRRMAKWLDLDGVAVGMRGTLAKALWDAASSTVRS